MTLATTQLCLPRRQRMNGTTTSDQCPISLVAMTSLLVLGLTSRRSPPIRVHDDPLARAVTGASRALTSFRIGNGP